MASPQFWAGRRVVVTGHTGFKGTWLATWLAELGAEVTGIGLAPATEPSLFAASGLPRRIHSRIGRRPLARAAGAASARGAARNPVPSRRAAAGDGQPGRPGHHLADQHPGRRQPARRGAPAAVLARSRRDHQRQMLPAARPALRRGRPAGRARPVQRQQGLRRDRRRRPTAPATSRPTRASASPRCARATSSAAATSRPAGCCPTWCVHSPPASPRSCAIPAGSGPGSTCSTRWPAICCWPSGWPPTRPRSRPPGTSARTRTSSWTAARIAELAARALRRRYLAGGRAATSRSRCRRCCCPPSRPGAGWVGARASTTEQAVHWAIDGYRALLRERDAGWLIEQIRAYMALDQAPQAGRVRAAAASRAPACLRLSRPKSRSSFCAAGRARALARSRRCAPSRCSTSATSRCSCTS